MRGLNGCGSCTQTCPCTAAVWIKYEIKTKFVRNLNDNERQGENNKIYPQNKTEYASLCKQTMYCQKRLVLVWSTYRASELMRAALTSPVGRFPFMELPVACVAVDVRACLEGSHCRAACRHYSLTLFSSFFAAKHPAKISFQICRGIYFTPVSSAIPIN